jgi:hypothetical protein
MNTISHSFPGKPVVAEIASCEPHGESCVPTRKRQRLITPLILTMGALLLSGCSGGITGIKLDPSSKTVCDPTGAVCGVSDSDAVFFQVLGQGKCGTIGVKYGDGAQESANGNFNLFNPAVIFFRHEYTTQHPLGPRAWPGPKTVYAYSVADCAGEAKMQVNVLRQRTNAAGQVDFTPTVRIGMAAPTAVACNVPTNTRPVRRGSTISITEVPGGPMINFGCAGNGCTNNTGGNSGATHPGFPFPALRRNSLVLRILSASGEEQVEQGQPVTRFVARVDGPLEFCVNDTVLTDNTGAWAMDVSVDETTVP